MFLLKNKKITGALIIGLIVIVFFSSQVIFAQSTSDFATQACSTNSTCSSYCSSHTCSTNDQLAMVIYDKPLDQITSDQWTAVQSADNSCNQPVNLSSGTNFVGCVSSGALAGAPPTAPQQTIPSIPGLDSFLLALYTVLYATTYIVGAILMFISGNLADYAINPNNLNPFADYIKPGINAGWIVLKNFANIIIIFFILFEAIKIVLRVGERSSIKTIFAIIATAVLINFSFLVSGLIWDAATITSLFFFQGMTGVNPLAPGISFSAYFLPNGLTGSLLGDFNSGYSLIKNSTAPQLGAIGILFLKFLMFVILFTVFLALFILLFIRVIIIAFLLMLAPLAWLGFGISSFKQHWSKWWDMFTRWAFFAPAALFFLFISIFIITQAGKTGSLWTQIQSYVNSTSGASQAAATGSNPSTFGADQTTQFFSLFLGMGLLVGSLIAANSTGIGVSGMVSATGQKAASWAVGGIAKTQAMAGLRQRLAKTGEDLTKSKSGMARFFGRQLYKAGTYKPKAVEEEEKDIKGQLQNKGVGALAGMNDRQRTRAIEFIARDDKLRAKLKEDQKDLIVRFLPQIDEKARNNILATMPHWGAPADMKNVLSKSDGRINLEEFYNNADVTSKNAFNDVMLQNPEISRLVLGKASGRNKVALQTGLDEKLESIPREFSALTGLTASANKAEFEDYLNSSYKTLARGGNKRLKEWLNSLAGEEFEAPALEPIPPPPPPAGGAPTA